MTFRFLWGRAEKRAAWLGELNRLATDAAIGNNLDYAHFYETVNDLSYHFSDDKDVGDQLTLALAAAAACNPEQARRLTYRGAAAAKPQSIVEQGLFAYWRDLSHDTLPQVGLHAAFLKAACLGRKGSALRAGALAEYEHLNRALAKTPGAPPRDLAKIFTLSAHLAARLHGHEAEKILANLLEKQLNRMSVDEAQVVAAEIDQDCTGKDWLRAVKINQSGFFDLPQAERSAQVWGVARRILQLG